MKGKYYLTTAIAYTSSTPHIGNVYEIVLADAIARYKRLDGYDVYFQTGTDEHGQKIQEKALANNKTPQAYVDEVAGNIRRIYDRMNTSYDNFVRTTDKKHQAQVQKIFKRLYDQGDIYKGEYEGLYCVPCESFFTETQLKEGKCPDCGGEVTQAKEAAYFLKMSKYQDRLIDHIKKHPKFIEPEARRNEMLNNFLSETLPDLCVSRTSFDWGIPVTFDQGHVVYVWIDALSNYITGIGYDADGGSSELYRKLWPAELHLIGKDILRFHTIYWPIILMALNEELPKQVFGHPWILVNKGKMSKSKGNTLFADELVDAFGVDAIRYYVLHEIPFAADGNMTYELIIERYNSDLANTLGNLVNRTLAMVHKYANGQISKVFVSDEAETSLIQTALQLKPASDKAMDQLKVSDAIEEVMKLLRRANKFIDESEPWNLAKSESTRTKLDAVLYALVESIRFATVMLQPFMPETAKAMFSQLNTDITSFDSLSSFGQLADKHTVGQAKALFTRLDVNEKLASLIENEETTHVATPAQKAETIKEEISIDDFAKVDLIVGRIIESKKHPKADKLLVSQVETGKGVKQIVSGIAQYYKPEDIVGRYVLVVANLKPVSLRGELSEGMLLCGSRGNKLELIEPQNLEAGDIVK